MNRKSTSNRSVFNLMLALSILLLSCAQTDSHSDPDLVALDVLMANPQQYADRYLCTEGVQVDGFEASGLAASATGKGSRLQLTEPVIWLESADLQSREDCTKTDGNPSYEFCHVVVCGIFETGGGYGHGGAYAYQMRGRELSARPTTTLAATGPIQIVLSTTL